MSKNSQECRHTFEGHKRQGDFLLSFRGPPTDSFTSSIFKVVPGKMLMKTVVSLVALFTLQGESILAELKYTF